MGRPEQCHVCVSRDHKVVCIGCYRKMADTVTRLATKLRQYQGQNLVAETTSRFLREIIAGNNQPKRKAS